MAKYIKPVTYEIITKCVTFITSKFVLQKGILRLREAIVRNRHIINFGSQFHKRKEDRTTLVVP